MFRNIDSLQGEKVELYDYMLVSWHLRLFMYLPTGFTASVSVDCFGNYGSLGDFCLKSLLLEDLLKGANPTSICYYVVDE